MGKSDYARPSIGESARPRRASEGAGRPDDLDGCAPLLAWVCANSGVTAPVAVARLGGSRGLVATIDIACGGRVVDVPAKLLLTLDVAMKSRAGVALAPIAKHLHARSILATHLILSRRDRTFACTYVDALPSSLDDHPTLCSQEHFRALANTTAGDIAAQLKATMREDYRRIAEHLPREDLFDRHEFGWAFCNVLSRAFNLKIGPAGFQPTMVPVVDLMNHSAQPNCAMCISPDGVCVEALADIGSGEELTISYGAHDNISLLAVWGFCVERNPERRALLGVPAATDDLLRSSLTHGREPASIRVWSGFLAPSYATPEVQALFGFLRSRQAYPFTDQWPGDACAHSFLQPAGRLDEIGALRDLLAACNARAISIRLRGSASDAATNNHPLARMAALAAQGELEVLSHFSDLAKSAIAVLEIDHAASARAALSSIADGGYVEALRLNWDTLWPGVAQDLLSGARPQPCM